VPDTPADPTTSNDEPEQPPELSEFANPDVEVPQEIGPEARRYPSTIGGVAFLLVLAGTLVGVGIMAAGRWRVGVLWMGVSLLAAAAARLVLPEPQAGMLHVRRRLVDVALLVGLGVGLLVAGASIPSR
jgi:hypothetical protein